MDPSQCIDARFRRRNRLYFRVDDCTIRVALKRGAWVKPSHPDIKRIVQGQVGQQRTHDTALQRAFRSLLQRAIQLLHGGTKPPRNVVPEPLVIRVVSYGAFNQVMPERNP